MVKPSILAVLLTSGVLAQSSPSNLSKLPLSFEPNFGQGERTAQFFARGPGYSVAVGPARAAISLQGNSNTRENIDIRFAGASQRAKPRPENLLPGTVNYFTGSDQKAWHTRIPTYAAVRYPSLYPGIDLVYYGQQDRLEFDFHVAPGIAPAAIRMAFTGSAQPRIDAAGDLLIGGMRQHKPVAYQLVDGNQRQLIACDYVLRANHEVAFKLGVYDAKRPLIIDPVIGYSSFVGGSGNESVTSIKVDAAGNLYMTGFTSSTNFPARGAAQPAYAGNNSPLVQMQFGDAFVAKLNPAGTSLIYATYIGGSGDDFAASIAVDASGNAYVVGSTQSSNFPTTTGVVQRTYKGFTANDNNGFYNPGDGFALKLNPAGNALLYATYLGGTLNDLALGVAVDSNGNAAVVGSTESQDFPTTANALAPKFLGNADVGSAIAGDAYLAILNPTATAFTYSTFLGGRGHDAARGVAFDSQNNVYVCGLTSSANFPVTTGAFQTVFQGSGTSNAFGNATTHGFVSKFTPQGTLAYSTLLGGSASDAAAAVAVDSTGAAYVTGSTTSPNFPVSTGAPQTTYKGRGTAGTFGDIFYGDAFVTKLNPAGSAAVYSTYLGGRGDDAGSDIAIDSAGNAYIAGLTISSDFPVSADATQPLFGGFGGQGLAPNSAQGFPSERVRNSGDAFLAKLSATGAVTYSTFFGGSQDDAGLTVATDGAGNAYVGGNTLSLALKTSSGAVQTAFGGFSQQFPRGDGFIVKFDFGGALPKVATAISLVPGFTATGTVGATLSTPFAVQAVDATGAPVSGVAIAFTATGASVNPATATTDAQGRASTVITLGTVAGAAKVTAAAAGLPAVSADLTITTVAPSGPVITAVANGASFLTNLAPGSWLTVFIDKTAAQNTAASAVPLPLTLGGFRILVNGNPIPMLAVTALSPGTQLNAQFPYETPLGSAQLIVEMNGVASAPFTFTVRQAAPGIFVFGNNRAVVQNVQPDGSLIVNTDATPVPAGDLIIAYLTGQGPLDNPIATNAPASGNPLSRATLPYSATLGTRQIPIDFLGMTPGLFSLAQANIRIPRDVAPGTYALSITIGGATSNGPVITVTTPRP